MSIEQVQRRVHALAEEAWRLARGRVEAEADIADRELVVVYASDVRAALDALERRLGVGRRGRFVVLEEEEDGRGEGEARPGRRDRGVPGGGSH